ncbi:MAG: hypothetical protein CM1200mP2_43690 [Planctomycetaceae bacterium]|nr:MAG: hypothetical protein CM1200mP2_43690 [Planctomycetaceae bacterium]
MLSLSLGQTDGRFCDGVSRRQMLRLGGTGALAGLSLPGLLELEAKAASQRGAQAKSVIMIFLEGGPSHIDMWDLKPEAPKEVRGSFPPDCDQCARHPDRQHPAQVCQGHRQVHDPAVPQPPRQRPQTGRHWCLTGHPPTFNEAGHGHALQLRVPLDRLDDLPGTGSRGSRTSLHLCSRADGPGGPGFFGAKYSPFVIETDPVQPVFQVRDLNLAAGTSRRRFDLRRRLLSGVEQLAEGRSGRGRAASMSTYYEKALELITSPAARKAFDMNSENPKLREQYGLTSLGQCCLLGRRLVEAGCRFVGISHGSWDTHVDNFTSHEKALVPHADAAFSTLLTDL